MFFIQLTTNKLLRFLWPLLPCYLISCANRPRTCSTETSEDISPYATFQLSEAGGNMSQPHHGGPANTLLHSFMYHERALAEGCSSPPPAAVLNPPTTTTHHHHHHQRPLKTIHNYYQTSPFHNIVRLFIHFFDLALYLSPSTKYFDWSNVVLPHISVFLSVLLRAFYVVPCCSCICLPFSSH